MSAPNLKEVEWAISELEQEESSLPNYEKLAIFYILREKMLGDAQPDPEPPLSTYSETAPVSEVLGQYGDSEFLLAVAGAEPSAALLIMDELMDTLRVVNNRAYESVIRKLEKL